MSKTNVANGWTNMTNAIPVKPIMLESISGNPLFSLSSNAIHTKRIRSLTNSSSITGLNTLFQISGLCCFE